MCPFGIFHFYVVGCRLGEFEIPIFTENEKCVSGAMININEECTFDCLAGYTLIGNTTPVKCVDNGVFVGSIPQCESKIMFYFLRFCFV